MSGAKAMNCRSSDWKIAPACALACVLTCLAAGCAPAPVEVPLHTRWLVDEVWHTVRENFHDPNLDGVDWFASRVRCLKRIGDQPSKAVASVNAMLDELHTSHTQLYSRNDAEYYQLLDIYRNVLGDDLKRIFPDGVVRYQQRADDGSMRMVQPLDDYLDSTRQSVKVIERDGVRIGFVRMLCWAGGEFQALLEELANTQPLQSCDGLILDIRGGWGGANPDAIQLFGCEAPVLELIARDGSSFRIEPAPSEIETERQWVKPMAVLIDRGTRSGKEVFAYACKSHNRGVLVGTPTAGAVVGGRPFLLGDGSLLIVATHDVRVNGVRLEGVGVTPDIFIESEHADPEQAAIAEAAEALASRIRSSR